MIRRVPLFFFATLALCLVPGLGLAQSDSLIVRPSHGDPGSAGNIVSVDMENGVGVGKIQFTLSFDSDLLNVTNVLPTARSGDMSTFNWTESVPGQVTVFILDLEGDTIDAGSGSIADFTIDVASDVHYGEIPLLLSGVGLHDADNQIVPTTAVNGQFIVTEPDIHIPVSNHDYGQIIVGNTSVWKATISNVGTKTMTINYVTSSSGEFSVEMLLYPRVLPPDSSLDVDLTFAPASTGTKSAKIYVFSDDPDENVAEIVVSGRGIAPEISVSKSSHDFGSVMGYSTATWTLTIHNVGGTASLTVTSITSNHTDFKVTSPTFPRMLAVDGSLNVSVAFTPKHLGPVSGTLTIVSNDPDERSVPITVSGTGYYPEATLAVVGGIGPEDSHGNVVPVSLSNAMSVGFIQFRFNYPPSILSVSNVRRTGRASLMSFFDWSEKTPGIVDVLIADISGSVTVSPGTAPVVEFLIDVDPGAVPGDAQLVLSDAVLTDISSNSIPAAATNGIFTIVSAPDIAVPAGIILFGDVRVGDSVARTLCVHNTGSGQLIIDSITVDHDSFRPEFSSFPQVVGPGDSLEGSIVFQPQTLGAASGAVTVSSNDPNEAQVSVAVSGTGVLPDVALSQNTIEFGDVWVTDTSRTVLTVSNTGSAALVISTIFVAPVQFEAVSNSLPATVPAGGTFQVSVGFHPTTTGPQSGSLSLQCDDPDEATVQVALSGTGIDPEMDMASASHPFGKVLLGEFLDWQLTVRNMGRTRLQIDSILSSQPDFTAAGMIFPTRIPARDSAQITIRFRPSLVGDRVGVLSIYSNDRDESPALVSVNGKGVIPDIQLSSTTHDFGNVVVADTAEWRLQLRNLDIGPLLIASITTNNSDFSVAEPDFPDTVAFGDSASVLVRCIPSNIGPATGILRITSNDPDEAHLSVSVGANGVVPDIALSSTNHYFGFGVLCDTVLWRFNIMNFGTADLTVLSIYADMPAYQAIAPVFPAVVGPQETLAVSVGFVPDGLGSIMGKLYVMTNDPDEPLLNLSLSGIGVAPDISLAQMSHDYGLVPVGYSQPWTVSVANRGTSNLIVDSAYVSSAVYAVVSPLFPQTVLPGKQIELTVSYSPQADGKNAASLTLLSNDCDAAVLNIMLLGAGYSIAVALPDTSGQADHTISVPITVPDLTGLDIYSWETRISFDPAFLTAVRATSLGSISQKWGTPVYSIAPGSIDIEMSGITALFGKGALVFITFLVDEGLSPGDLTPLRLETFQFNDGAPAAALANGSLHVNRPPVIDTIAAITAHEGLAMQFTVTATDPDRDALAFSAANLPAGSSFDPAAQRFQWTPPFGSAGMYSGLRFRVTDGQFTDSTTASINVESSVRVMVPDTTRPAGMTFGLPVILLDAVEPQDSIFSMDLILTYDPSVLTAVDATIGGTLTAGWGPLAYRVTEGQISFGIVGFVPLQGSGVLVYINFSVLPGVSAGDSSEMTLASLQFNDGDPSASAISGVLRIPLYSIAGQLSYYMAHSPGNPIDNALMQVIGSEALTDWSDDNGGYNFPNLVGGLGYAIRPSKNGDWRDAIQSFDASLVTRYVVGLETLQTHQKVAADVTGNGTVSALDASQILQFRVGLIDEFSIGEDWTFEPDQRDYPHLDVNYAEDDYLGILYGDVSGNWGEPGTAKMSLDPAALAQIADASALPGESLTIPVSLGGGQSVLAADIDVSYDPRFVQVTGVERTGLSSDCLLEYAIVSGQLRMAMAGTHPLAAGGELVHILCRVSPQMPVGDSTRLTFSVRLNETLLPDMLGKITAVDIPTEYALSQNYPNPFNPATTICYQIPNPGFCQAVHVSLKVYNILGQEVATLVDEVKEPGYHAATWDASSMSSGVYFYRLQADNCSIMNRMMLVR